MVIGHAEDPFDHGRIADTDLYVGLLPEAGGPVEPFPFHEDATDGVERSLIVLFSTGMDKVDDCAIQFAMQIIFSATVCG